METFNGIRAYLRGFFPMATSITLLSPFYGEQG